MPSNLEPVRERGVPPISRAPSPISQDSSPHSPSNAPPPHVSPQDAWCAELWRIHFLAAELGHMGGCNDTCPPTSAPQDAVGCVGRERTNVSRMLSALNGHLVALSSKMLRQAGPVDFTNCTSVRCQPGTPLRPPWSSRPAASLVPPETPLVVPSAASQVPPESPLRSPPVLPTPVHGPLPQPLLLP
uniref:Uncharacterized protein n=1 Tax=Chrysemys picta bellii TaxID=8478 RepID=A0A8C3HN80_CHRPI